MTRLPNGAGLVLAAYEQAMSGARSRKERDVLRGKAAAALDRAFPGGRSQVLDALRLLARRRTSEARRMERALRYCWSLRDPADPLEGA